MSIPLPDSVPVDPLDQFEVTYWDAKDQKRKVYARPGTLEGALAICNSIKLNPGMGHAKIRDRDKVPDARPPAPPAGDPAKPRAYDVPE